VGQAMYHVFRQEQPTKEAAGLVEQPRALLVRCKVAADTEVSLSHFVAWWSRLPDSKGSLGLHELLHGHDARGRGGEMFR
jgi:hypothetical protein